VLQVCAVEPSETLEATFEWLYTSPVSANTANRRWSRYSTPNEPEPLYVFVEGDEGKDPPNVEEDRWYPNLGLRYARRLSHFRT
jgi:hypothetical protein